MFLKSIRWRLQIWYGLILVVVLTGFGVTAYRLERGRQFRNIDEQLQRRAAALVNSLRPAPRGRGPGPPPQRGPGARMPDLPSPDVKAEAGIESNGQPPLRTSFELPPEIPFLFDENDPNGFYYDILWGRGRMQHARSTNAPDAQIDSAPPPAIAVDAPAPGGDFRRGPHSLEMQGNFRELEIRTPRGDQIKVGRSIAPELAELRRVKWGLTSVGVVVLLLGLAGGWWIATRAIRPVEEISATATRIAGGDLSQRINTADTDSELGRLAGVLNSTFARLQTSFAQQARFTADAAHELRTPISVVLTQTQMTLNRERSPEEYRETVEACQRAAQRMRRLVESLLELARLDAGQEQMKRMRFNLSNTVRDCVELVRPLADQGRVTIECDLVPTDYEGDSERLGQVITNLLTNAIQHTPENGEVQVEVRPENDTVNLTVRDKGSGIPAADLPHVLERFYRVDKARSGTTGNSGLGLAISKAIVETHGGTMAISSQLGAGTTVTVHLPTSRS